MLRTMCVCARVYVYYCFHSTNISVVGTNTSEMSRYSIPFSIPKQKNSYRLLNNSNETIKDMNGDVC